MAWIKNISKAKMSLLLLSVLTLAVANASVFVYYTSSLTIQASKPPVYLQAGGNANGPDLGGKTILVNVGSGGASATLTLHPTYGKTYYKNVLRVVNQDNESAYTVHLRVTNPLSDTLVTSAKVYVYDDTGKRQATLDLMDSNNEVSFTLSAGKTYTIDVEIVISENGGSPSTAPNLTDTQASFDLIYTFPGTVETPP